MMRRLLLCAALLAAGCGGSSTSPAPLIPNYAGNWTGTYSIAGCTQTGVFILPNLCPVVLGQPVNFKMMLTQSGSTVVGTLLIGVEVYTHPDATINSSSGSLVIVGTNTTDKMTRVATWSLATPITGTASRTTTVSDADGQMVENGAIVSAIRQ